MKIGNSIIDSIFNNYNQVELFSKYTGIKVEYIQYCLMDKKNKIRNPLRDDYSPSMGFMYTDKGKLISKDWANDAYSGDIFDMVAVLTGKNCSNSRDFIDIVNFILKDGKLDNNISRKNTDILNKKTINIIKIQPSPLYYLQGYFSKVSITDEYLKFRNVFNADNVWVNNMNIPYLRASKSNPIIAYYTGRIYDIDLFKTYRPRGGKNNKFLTNSNKLFESPQELYKTSILIITKSRKDKLTIESNLIDESGKTIAEQLLCKQVPEYCVTSYNSETYYISPDIAKWLSETYDYVVINTDFDKTGILNAFYHNIIYGFIPVMLGNDKISMSDFNDHEITNIFNRITLVYNTTLHIGLLNDFIEEHKDNFNEKDLYEYGEVNGKNKLIELINDLFEYKKIAYE